MIRTRKQTKKSGKAQLERAYREVNGSKRMPKDDFGVLVKMTFYVSNNNAQLGIVESNHDLVNHDMITFEIDNQNV